MATRIAAAESLRAPVEGTRRRSRGGRPPLSFIGTLVYVAAVWLLVFAVAPMLIGWWPTVIGSGSMAPSLREGDVAIIAPHTGGGLEPGAVIVFQVAEGRSATIHRIVGVTPDGAYITKGDANAGIDSAEVRPYQVQGVARLLVPYVGLPAHWLRTRNWSGLAGFAGVMVMAAWLIHWRPAQGGSIRAGRPARRWAAVGTMSVVLVSAVGATTVAAFSDGTDNPASVLSAGSWMGIAAITGGEGHSCVAMDSGAAYCWGDNTSGQIGDGTNTDRLTATRVIGAGGTGYLTDVVTIAAGREHTCAVLADGSAYCWGEGGQGQLGHGSTTDRRWPEQVLGIKGKGFLSGVVEIEAGRQHTCARLADTTAACWGDNARGQLGDRSTTDRLSPSLVRSAARGRNLTDVADLGLGELHTCAALTDGSAFCWGEGSQHRLGNGSTSDTDRPEQVVGPGGAGFLSGVVSIDGGNQHSCAATSSGSAYCWGSNLFGALGIGSTSDSTYPSQVLDRGGSGALPGVSSISLGRDHSCARHSDGSASCWGSNLSGQIGDGTTTQRTSPVQVVGGGGTGTLSGVSGLSAGYDHTASTVSGLEAWTWGSNSSGQLGDGTTTDRTSPVRASGL